LLLLAPSFHPFGSYPSDPAVVVVVPMAGVARVQLPAETGPREISSARARTLSRTGSEADSALVSTILPQSMSAAALTPMGTESALGDYDDGEAYEDLPTLVARMEDMQAQQRSIQQPNPELDSLIHRVLMGHPERRQRMAVLTKSALLRKKILTCLAQGCRSAGSMQLGHTHHWRQKLPDSVSDHNWPKAVHNEHGLHHLPGGAAHHDAHLRCPVDKLRYHPTLARTELYSIPRTKRFPGCHDDGTINKIEAQLRSPPGPGAYFKSVPRGTAFSVDGGETIVMGANHTYPWKTAMGRQINPINVDLTTQVSAPCFSFPKTRRNLSDTRVGHDNQDGGAVKSDSGNLSPGHVYEFLSSMRPLPTDTMDGTRSTTRKKIRERTKLGSNPPRIRCIPMPEPAETTEEPE